MDENGLHILNLYLPDWLCRLVHSADAGEISGYYDVRPASVMFADVSGFTPLSEELANMGKEGAEELTRILNGYFDDMIGIVREYGGDVCKFGGDAMTVLWEKGEGEDDKNHSLTVLACASALQKRMKAFTGIKSRSGKSFSLTMKIGIARGEVLFTCCGDPDRRMEHVTAGGPVDGSADAEHYASSGQIVIDGNTRKAVGDEIKFDSPAEGFYLLKNSIDIPPDRSAKTEVSVDPSEVGLLRSFVLPEIREHIETGSITWLSEHRNVAVIFLQFEGLHYDDNRESAAAGLNELFTETEKIVSDAGGTINRLDTGDKGSKMLILFGAPTAHENNGYRALIAASRLKKAYSRMTFPDDFRIGITEGKVFCGNVGARLRSEYTVMGDYVNLSARLMGAAPGNGVLVHGELRETAGGLFLIHNRQPVKVKGNSEPIDIFELGEPEYDAEETAERKIVIGREKPVAELLSRIDGTLRGKCFLISLSGKPGTGKSHLAAWAQSVMDEKGFRTFYVQCHAHTGDAPFFVWTLIFESLMDLKDKRGAERESAFLDFCRELVPEMENRFFLLGGTLGIALEVPEEFRGLDEKLKRDNLFEICSKIIYRAGNIEPLGIRLDDTKWMDSLSVEFLTYLVKRISRGRVVILETHREEDEFQWVNLKNCFRLTLGPFDRNEFEKYLEHILGGRPDEELLQWIDRKSRRNPRFASEILEGLLESGNLERMASGRFRFTADFSPAEIPDGIQQLALAHIDRLPAKAKTVIKTAACAGAHFPERLLFSVLPEDLQEKERADILDTLRNEGLIVHAPRAEEKAYMFSSLLYQESAYETVPYEMRRDLHKSIGGYLEDENRKGLNHPPALLSHHFNYAEIYDKAYNYSRIAADQARERYAHREAIDHYRLCVKIMDRAGNLPETELIDLKIKLARCYRTMGDYGESLGIYRTALSEATSKEYWKEAFLIMDGLAEAHMEKNDYESAHKVILEMERLACKNDMELARASALRWLGYISHHTGEYMDAVEYLQKALEIFGNIGKDAQKTICFLYMGHSYLNKGDLDRAKEYYLKGEKSGRLEDKQRLAVALIGLGNVGLRSGDLEEAQEYFERSAGISREIGDKYTTATTLLNLGNLYQSGGDLEQAGECFRRAMMLCNELGTAAGVSFCSNNLGSIYLLMGKYDRAAESFERAAETNRELGDIANEAMALSNMGEARNCLKDYGKAEEYCRKSIEIQEKIGNDEGKAYALSGLAEALLGKGDNEGAREHVSRCLELSETNNYREPQGTCYRLKGALEDSEEYFEKSEKLFREDGNDYQLALTLEAGGRQLANKSEKQKARKILSEAADIFKRLKNEKKIEEIADIDIH